MWLAHVVFWLAVVVALSYGSILGMHMKGSGLAGPIEWLDTAVQRIVSVVCDPFLFTWVIICGFLIFSMWKAHLTERKWQNIDTPVRDPAERMTAAQLVSSQVNFGIASAAFIIPMLFAAMYQKDSVIEPANRLFVWTAISILLLSVVSGIFAGAYVVNHIHHKRSAAEYPLIMAWGARQHWLLIGGILTLVLTFSFMAFLVVLVLFVVLLVVKPKQRKPRMLNIEDLSLLANLDPEGLARYELNEEHTVAVAFDLAIRRSRVLGRSSIGEDALFAAWALCWPWDPQTEEYTKFIRSATRELFRSVSEKEAVEKSRRFFLDDILSVDIVDLIELLNRPGGINQRPGGENYREVRMFNVEMLSMTKIPELKGNVWVRLRS